MAKKKQALGRGLGALMEDAPKTKEEKQPIADTIDEIELENIEINPFQPRKEFDTEGLNELAASIKKLGIIQPVTVRKTDEGKYQLITGERRYRASKIAGLGKIPAFIRTADDQGMLELALVENIQREDLNAMEIAICYQRLIEECSLTQESLSDRIGKKRATVANYLRLLKLPAEIQLGLKSREISMGHARALINIENPKSQLVIFKRIIAENLSVREVEDIVRNFNEQPKKASNVAKKISSLSDEYMKLQNHLSDYFKSKIEFKRNSKGNGKIIISFKSDEDLERILGIFDNFQA